MKTEVISFRKVLGAYDLFNGRSPETSLKERLKADGRVIEFRIRFYPGVEKALRVRPYVKHKGHREEDFVTFPENTLSYIVGDNDYLIFPCSIDFEYDDEIFIFAQNVDSINSYTLSVDVIVTYFEDEVL